MDEEEENSTKQKVQRSLVTIYVEELDKIALRPFVTTPEYADLMD